MTAAATLPAQPRASPAPASAPSPRRPERRRRSLSFSGRRETGARCSREMSGRAVRGALGSTTFGVRTIQECPGASRASPDGADTGVQRFLVSWSGRMMREGPAAGPGRVTATGESCWRGSGAPHAGRGSSSQSASTLSRWKPRWRWRCHGCGATGRAPEDVGPRLGDLAARAERRSHRR